MFLNNVRVLVVLGAALGFSVGSAAYARPGLPDLDPFNPNSAIHKAGVRPGDIIHVPAAPPPGGELSHLSQQGATFRTGRIMLRNTYEGPVTVNLYHPAAPNVVFRSYVLQRGEYSF